MHSILLYPPFDPIILRNNFELELREAKTTYSEEDLSIQKVSQTVLSENTPIKSPFTLLQGIEELEENLELLNAILNNNRSFYFLYLRNIHRNLSYSVKSLPYSEDNIACELSRIILGQGWEANDHAALSDNFNLDETVITPEEKHRCHRDLSQLITKINRQARQLFTKNFKEDVNFIEEVRTDFSEVLRELALIKKFPYSIKIPFINKKVLIHTGLELSEFSIYLKREAKSLEDQTKEKCRKIPEVHIMLLNFLILGDERLKYENYDDEILDRAAFKCDPLTTFQVHLLYNAYMGRTYARELEDQACEIQEETRNILLKSLRTTPYCRTKLFVSPTVPVDQAACTQCPRSDTPEG